MWEKINYVSIGTRKVPVEYIELHDMLMIIDDALTNGFELKVENRCIYYRWLNKNLKKKEKETWKFYSNQERT